MSGQSNLERATQAQRRALLRALGGEIRRQREDAGLTRAALAREADVDPAYLGRIEDGVREPSLTTLVRIGIALGSDLRVRYFPNSGPRIRDRHQAPMLEAVLRDLHPRWIPYAEVAVHRPVRGVIDLVLHDPIANLLVAHEAESTLRRLEQQIRWSRQKAEGLAFDPRWASGAPRISRALILRSTTETRELAHAVPAILAAAYPASPEAALTSLRGAAPWPGDTLLWARVESGRAVLLPGRTGRARG